MDPHQNWRIGLKAIRRLALLTLFLCFAGAQAQAPQATLTLSRNAGGETLATVTGTVAACGLTALNEVPRFKIQGTVIAVTQPVVGIACMNPPPKEKPYEQTLNFGKLPAGTYTIKWSFPALTASYETPDK